MALEIGAVMAVSWGWSPVLWHLGVLYMVAQLLLVLATEISRCYLIAKRMEKGRNERPITTGD